MIRVLVVDDEPLARRKLVALLRDAADVQVVGECRSGAEAIAMLREETVDLVFLDVQMPEVSGLELIDVVGPDRMPAVVFVTAHDRYALQAFEIHAVDYLLKPFARARFQATLDRARARLASSPGPGADAGLIQALAQLERERSGLQRITVQHDGRISFVSVEDIVWIESDSNYLLLHTADASHRVRGTVKAIEARLDPNRFVRVARGTLVNLSRVREIQPWFRGELILQLQDRSRLTVSATFAARFREVIENPF